MTFLAVLPSIDNGMTSGCLATLAPELRAATLVVDNTEINRGVPASWNLGAHAVLGAEADWLIVLSAACRFGERGGLDLIAALDEHRGAIAMEANGAGWHCIAFSARALSEVGLFDERFYPAYYEDNDWAYRAYCAYSLDPNPDPAVGWWPHVDVDATVIRVAHGLDAGVQVNMMGQLAKYEAKHGGPPSAEAFRATWGVCPKCGHVWEHCLDHGLLP